MIKSRTKLTIFRLISKENLEIPDTEPHSTYFL